MSADTWMHERYGCDGTMQTNRTAAYFEYPSTVAILNREIRYGIEIDFKKVTVRPNAPSFVSEGQTLTLSVVPCRSSR